MRFTPLLPLVGALLPYASATPTSNACIDGQQYCNAAGTLMKCNANHVWFPSPCPPGQSCDLMSNACQTPSEMRCKANTWRCRDNQIEHCVREKWIVQETCRDGLICGSGGRGGGVVGCRKPLSTIPTGEVTAAPRTDVKIPAPCVPGHKACDTKLHSVRVCGDDQMWVRKEQCFPNGYCETNSLGQAHCNGHHLGGHKRRTPQPCTSGDRNCHGNVRDVMLCNAQGVWEVEKTCVLGLCKDDAPNQAHCEGSDPQPPVAPRNAAVCHPGNRACDFERRFIFTCDEHGQWAKPNQCFGPGFCKPHERDGQLTCTGFPLYGGHNETCDSSCETMKYLHCFASLDTPEVREDCRQTMCWTNQCVGCDRCSYKQPPGGVKPDLSTLWSPNQDI